MRDAPYFTLVTLGNQLLHFQNRPVGVQIFDYGWAVAADAPLREVVLFCCTCAPVKNTDGVDTRGTRAGLHRRDDAGQRIVIKEMQEAIRIDEIVCARPMLKGKNVCTYPVDGDFLRGCQCPGMRYRRFWKRQGLLR